MASAAGGKRVEPSRYKEEGKPRVFLDVDDVCAGGQRDAVQCDSSAGFDGYRGEDASSIVALYCAR